MPSPQKSSLTGISGRTSNSDVATPPDNQQTEIDPLSFTGEDKLVGLSDFDKTFMTLNKNLADQVEALNKLNEHNKPVPQGIPRSDTNDWWGSSDNLGQNDNDSSEAIQSSHAHRFLTLLQSTKTQIQQTTTLNDLKFLRKTSFQEIKGATKALFQELIDSKTSEVSNELKKNLADINDKNFLNLIHQFSLDAKNLLEHDNKLADEASNLLLQLFYLFNVKEANLRENDNSKTNKNKTMIQRLLQPLTFTGKLPENTQPNEKTNSLLEPLISPQDRKQNMPPEDNLSTQSATFAKRHSTKMGIGALLGAGLLLLLSVVAILTVPVAGEVIASFLIYKAIAIGAAALAGAGVGAGCGAVAGAISDSLDNATSSPQDSRRNSDASDESVNSNVRDVSVVSTATTNKDSSRSSQKSMSSTGSTTQSLLARSAADNNVAQRHQPRGDGEASTAASNNLQAAFYNTRTFGSVHSEDAIEAEESAAMEPSLPSTANRSNNTGGGMRRNG